MPEVKRVWEQSPDAVSFYSDYSQVIKTTDEIIVQFFEPIPALPNEAGGVAYMRSRLKATVVIAKPHALKLGQLLVQEMAAGAT